MPEPIDETDGTPEWAKRMFRRRQMIRTGALILFLGIGLPVMCSYQIYQALATGQVWRFMSPRRMVSYAEEPALFIVSLVLAVGLLAMWGMGLAFYHRVRRVPEHLRRRAE